MSEIRSSFEIAMDRVKNIDADKASLKKKNALDFGRSLCNKYMSGEINDVVSEISNYQHELQDHVRDGICEALLRQVYLPSSQTYLEQFDRLVTLAKKFTNQEVVTEQLFDQFRNVVLQYLEEQSKLGETIRMQFEQMIRQNPELAAQLQQMGGNIAAHPKFVQIINEQRKKLDEHFAPSVRKVRNNLRQLCGMSLEK